jgi:hypothetical protein
MQSVNNVLVSRLAAFALASLVSLASQSAFGFEDTRVMPKGVRRLTFRLLNTNIAEKTSSDGERRSLGRPLEKDLTFKDIVKNESNLTKRSLTKGFLGYAGYSDPDSVGTFDADVKTRLTVFAPIATYGLTDKVTLAAAFPIYNMATSVDAGFNANATGQAFVNALGDGWNNQRISALEATEKINNAVQRLNDKLDKNGYRQLENWQKTAPGDLQLLAKVRTFDAGFVSNALTLGTVAPTGRIDDPDNLIDKGFGDGQWDIFGGTAFDQPLGETGISFNQYGKYTWQLPGRRTVRLATEDETIEVEKRSTAFKLGDKIDAGASLQYAPDFGLVSGTGYNFSHKNADVYDAPSDAKAKLQKDTLEQAHQLEVELGYSAVPAYRRGQVPVPFEAKLNYKHQLASRNMPVTHLLQFDAGVFF